MSLPSKILLVILVLFIISIGPLFYFIRYEIYTPFDNSGEAEIITIAKGEGSTKIGEKLTEEGIIRNKIWFMAYAYFKNRDTRLQAGEYELSSAMNIPELVYKISSGEIISDEIKITIPEGFTLKKIDARLAQAGLIKSGDLLKNQDLEGYLFPDTYIFSRKDSLDDIIKKMRDNFDKKITSGLLEEINRQNKTLKDIIIMASIIEKEVASDEDRRIVSGIFWKRAGDNYLLQADSTTAYILGVDKWIYSNEDNKVDSPYNTYLYPGLPIGPISNPGLSAIKAAVYPALTDYYYFLSTPEGETIYSKTLVEHERNINRYLKF